MSNKMFCVALSQVCEAGCSFCCAERETDVSLRVEAVSENPATKATVGFCDK